MKVSRRGLIGGIGAALAVPAALQAKGDDQYLLVEEEGRGWLARQLYRFDTSSNKWRRIALQKWIGDDPHKLDTIKKIRLVHTPGEI